MPTPQILTSLKAATTSLTSQNSSYHKLMLGVRECYTSREVVQGEKMKFDNEAGVVPGGDEGDECTCAGKLEEIIHNVCS